MSSESLVVCLEFPVFHQPRYVERLRALPGVEPVVLPIDPDGDWGAANPSLPHAEPPVWAQSVGEARRAVFERAQVLVALNTPEDLLEKAPNLVWIQGIGAGMEQFARAGAARSDVLVTNASGMSSASMAEWVVGRLLQVWKRFREADDFQRERRFERSYGSTFGGSTVGIVGLGHIGRAVAERVRPFGCRVLGLKRSYRPGDASDHADELFGPDQLHAMLARCDAVVIAAPATADTRHLIDAEALAAMQPHAVLVNVARGSLVDERALADALKGKRLKAAILDVFDQEPLPDSSPLWDLDDVYLSAHSSVSVDRYMDDVFELVLDNVKRYRSGDELRNVVQLES